MTLGEAKGIIDKKRYDRLVFESRCQPGYYPLSSSMTRLFFTSIVITQSPDIIYFLNQKNYMSLSFVDNVQIQDTKKANIDRIIISCTDPDNVHLEYVVYASYRALFDTINIV